MTCEEAGCYEAAIISIRKDPFGKSDAMRHLCSHHAPRWLAVSGQVNEKAIGGSDVCHTCAAHVKVITEDLEPRIRALEAELAAEKMQHSVTIADEHESRTAFQDGIRAIEAELIGEMKLRQTAEAYAARNALRVIALQDALRKIVRDGDYTAHEGMKRIANEALATEPETLVDLKDPHNAHHPDRLKGPGLTAKETACKHMDTVTTEKRGVWLCRSCGALLDDSVPSERDVT